MPKGYVIANTGKGKTLYASLYALEWSRNHPNGKIYANYHLNLPNAYFTPLMFLPFDDLHDCLIIYDDVSNLDEIKRFSKVCANWSRKTSMELFFTAQFYTMIPKQLRDIADYKVKTVYYKSKDLLVVYINYREVGVRKVVFHDAVKTVKALNLYDTKEVVRMATESEVINKIIELSKTKRDIEMYLMVFTGNKAERKSLLKEIMKKKGLSNENGEEDSIHPLDFKIIFLLSEGYSEREISRKLGITRGKVQYTREKFRKENKELINRNV